MVCSFFFFFDYWDTTLLSSEVRLLKEGFWKEEVTVVNMVKDSACDREKESPAPL